ncbi:MAG: magnesium/cobalt transporter CorA [bacterium]
MKIFLFDRTSQSLQEGGPELVSAYAAGNHFIWVHLEPEDENAGDVLRQQFNINPLAVTDALRDRHPPKQETFEDFEFLLLKGLSAEVRELDYQTLQIALFISEDYLITRSSKFSPSIDRVWTQAREHQSWFSSNPKHLAYRICRAVADRYTNILLSHEVRLEELEEQIFTTDGEALLSELLEGNKTLKKLHRAALYQANIFSELTKGVDLERDADLRHAWVDVYEQFERIASLSLLYQELTSELMNVYMSWSSHQLNKIMKVLTIATVIFLPLGLLAGIYGMNFDVIPELHYKYGYFVVIGVMVSLVTMMLFVFKRFRWI